MSEQSMMISGGNFSAEIDEIRVPLSEIIEEYQRENDPEEIKKRKEKRTVEENAQERYEENIAWIERLAIRKRLLEESIAETSSQIEEAIAVVRDVGAHDKELFAAKREAIQECRDVPLDAIKLDSVDWGAERQRRIFEAQKTKLELGREN